MWKCKDFLKSHDSVVMTTITGPPFLLRGGLLNPNFEKKGGVVSEKKMSAWVDLKSSCYRYFFAGSHYYVLCQTRLCKIKYGFEDSISNGDLGLL